MPRLEWNAVGSRFYEAGVDRGVLYVGDNPGVVWNGLTSVNENPSGGEAKPHYVDGVKYRNTSAPEEFEATITAFTYPDEFAECDGTHQPRLGMFIAQQRRKPFGLTYRTKVGSDTDPEFGYKIHIVYNALASPSSQEHSTLDSSIDPNDFSWKITTRPPFISDYRPMSHVVVDSRTTDPSVLSDLEDALYGTEVEAPYLPTFAELVEIFDRISELTVVDNGDGSFTVTAPGDEIRMLDETTFQITSSAAVFIDDDSYTLSSP